MSDQRGVAAVTATLRGLLTTAADSAVAGTLVSTGVPTVPVAATADSPRINLFLFRVTANASWRNVDVVTERAGSSPSAPSQLDRRVTIPLTLQYLLSFHGNESQLVPQQLFAAAAGVLHGRPVLTGDDVAAVLGTSSPFSGSGLEDDLREVEPVRLRPLDLDLEDLSRLWTAFPQVPYALPMTFEASVVLLQPQPAASELEITDVVLQPQQIASGQPLAPSS